MEDLYQLTTSSLYQFPDFFPAYKTSKEIIAALFSLIIDDMLARKDDFRLVMTLGLYTYSATKGSRNLACTALRTVFAEDSVQALPGAPCLSGFSVLRGRCMYLFSPDHCSRMSNDVFLPNICIFIFPPNIPPPPASPHPGSS